MQVWWPSLLQLAVERPFLLPQSTLLLRSQTGGSPPPDQQQNVVPVSMADIGRYWESQGFLQDAAMAILSSWASGTRKQYDSALKKWHCWCVQQCVDTLSPSIKDVANFLIAQQRAGLQYNSIAVIKLVVCTVLDSLNEQALFTGDSRITRVMKGLFRMAPPLPKHLATWDVTNVLNALKTWGHSETLRDKLLSLKLTMLLALCSPKWLSEVANLWLSCMRTFDDRVVFTLPGMNKNRGSRPPHEAIYTQHPETLLCPVHTLSDYIARTSGWRGTTDKLLLSYVGRHQAIGPASVTRWICTMLSMSGVDTRFTAHSMRSAATSKAARAGLSAAQIMAAANWSPGSTTFARFYLKPIRQGFSAAVLTSENAEKTGEETRRSAATDGRDRSLHAVEEAKAKDTAADGDDLSEEFCSLLAFLPVF
uniref:Tyr recombinase domain-containing protein n=1 Tax=Plectus sambesii TaxID=2011161 RepID=A0A914W9P3_9BILA